MIIVSPVPLATLVSATTAPKTTGVNTILSPEGYKRYFVVHGGLFSKDGVTLDDVRKIPRIGRQPGQDGLMCAYPRLSTRFLLTHFPADVCIHVVPMCAGI
jgi:serine/threonine-protein phosphatase 5